MKIISLLQPWATLLVQGHKTVETRSFGTSYRGPLYIHASGALNKKMDNGLTPYEQAVSNEHFRKCILNPNLMKFGVIVGMVNIEEIIKVDPHIPPPKEYFKRLTSQELAFGNYEVGRSMWFCNHAVEFKRPPIIKGTQGIREFTSYTHCAHCDNGLIPSKEGFHITPDEREVICRNIRKTY